MTEILIALVCFLFFLVLFLSWKLFKFSLLIIKIEDAIEESLDILDERYRSMNEIINRPVFFDSVEIRQVINDIKLCHASIMSIALKLTGSIDKSGGKVAEIEEKDQKDK